MITLYNGFTLYYKNGGIYMDFLMLILLSMVASFIIVFPIAFIIILFNRDYERMEEEIKRLKGDK